MVQTLGMERVVVAPKFLSELRMLPESKLSHSAALVNKWLGYYSGLDVILQNRQHSDVCRVQLTQNLSKPSTHPANSSLKPSHHLGHFAPEMAEELDLAMNQFLKDCTPEGE